MPLSYVKSLKGPFDNTAYVAIGGVDAKNASDFIDAGCIGVGLGSNIAPKDAIANRDWTRVTKYVSQLCERVRR